MKIKRSRVPGKVPHVSQFTDSTTVVWNEADGKLFGMRIDYTGNRVVVLIGGGVSTIGEVHARLHAIDSAADHAPVPGKILVGNPSDQAATPSCIHVDTVKVMLGQVVDVTTDTGNINFHVAGQPEDPIRVAFSSIDHNQLKNFDALRHKRMQYSDELKAYMIEP